MWSVLTLFAGREYNPEHFGPLRPSRPDFARSRADRDRSGSDAASQGESIDVRCPYCKKDKDKVIDSRSASEAAVIRRRRLCLECGRRYTTYERLEEMTMKVVKKDAVREPFDREKIRQGLARACWKRPISDEQIESVVLDVENEIYATFDSEVDSRVIGELVMQQLGKLDQVAYVRFASVYRDFKDVDDFVDELTPMLSRKSSAAAGDG